MGLYRLHSLTVHPLSPGVCYHWFVISLSPRPSEGCWGVVKGWGCELVSWWGGEVGIYRDIGCVSGRRRAVCLVALSCLESCWQRWPVCWGSAPVLLYCDSNKRVCTSVYFPAATIEGFLELAILDLDSEYFVNVNYYQTSGPPNLPLSTRTKKLMLLQEWNQHVPSLLQNKHMLLLYFKVITLVILSAHFSSIHVYRKASLVLIWTLRDHTFSGKKLKFSVFVVVVLEPPV